MRVLEEFPRTPIGKIDRGALPAIEFVAAEFVAPRTELEATVAAVVASVLDIDRVSVTSGFFEGRWQLVVGGQTGCTTGEVLDRPVGVEDVSRRPPRRPAELAVRLAEKNSAPRFRRWWQRGQQ